MNLEIPQTIATVNNNTGQIEIGLVEEVYTDKENTDQPLVLKSKDHAPFVISVGVINMEGDASPMVIVDANQTELNCVD